jgi:glycosyltransferase involved in cell wall biosynthesis
MASSSSRLTVLVPTLNRADTLYHCLRTIVGQPNSDLDILVSDNCSSEETKAVIDQFSDPRLRSIRPPSRLGMSEHWEFALNHVTSEWVTIVGDDDGLLPHAVDRFYDAIQGENVKAVVSLSCGFHWPC